MALAEPRARTVQDVACTRRIGCVADLKRPRPHELLERNVLDAAVRILTPSGIVDNAAAAGINSMVSISAATDDDPSARDELSVHGFTRDDKYDRRCE